MNPPGKCRLFLATVAAALLVAQSAVAEERAVQAARQYTQQHNLGIRTVATGPANRRVTRHFVPITPQTYHNFLATFSQPNGFLHLSYVQSNRHITMGLRPPENNQPTDCYLWARNYNGKQAGLADCRTMYMKHEAGAYVVPVPLAQNNLQHLDQWLQARANPQDALFRGGNCMEWLSNAEVGPNTPLFHAVGLKRSRDGGNMKAKLLHASNDKVSVVGVCVADMNAFNAMTEQQLLGPPPAGGLDDAAR